MRAVGLATGSPGRGAAPPEVRLTLKLTYFDAKGVVEPTRMMLHMAGVKFEDIRYPVEVVDGRPSCPKLDEELAKGTLQANLGHVPVLEVTKAVVHRADPDRNTKDVFVVATSATIERYVARVYGFLGDNDEEAALVDGFCEHLRTIKQKFENLRAIKVEKERDDALKKWFDRDIKHWLGELEKVLKLWSRVEGFAVGYKPSLADLSLFLFAQEFFDKELLIDRREVPKVKAVIDAVASNSAAKLYLRSRPTDTLF